MKAVSAAAKKSKPVEITFEVNTPTTLERKFVKLDDVKKFGVRAAHYPPDALDLNGPFVMHGSKYVLEMKSGERFDVGVILYSDLSRKQDFPDAKAIAGKSGAEVQAELPKATRK